MAKLRQLWDIKDLPVCDTSTCPLEALKEQGTSNPEIYAYTRRECYCQSEEYSFLTQHSLSFTRAQSFLTEQEAGLPPDDDLVHDFLFRHAVVTLKHQLKLLESEAKSKAYGSALEE